MKVGQFTDSFLPIVDGVGRVVSNYAEIMGARCEACYVITPRNRKAPPERSIYERVEFMSTTLPGLPQYRIGFPQLDAAYRRHMATIELDIAHAHDPFIAGREAYRISRRQGIPLVATFHSKFYDDFYQITHSKRLAKLGVNKVVKFYNQCDQVWAVSDAAAKVLRTYGYEGEIEVVKNGTDIKEADPKAIRLVNERYSLGQLPVLLYVGQMSWKKNIRRILETADILHRQGRDFRLLMAGQGPSEADIRALSSSLGLDRIVIFTGHISGALLDGLYARASLFIFPSLYDTAGLVVSEAAAAATPSLLVRGSSAADAVRHGENALLAEDDPQDLAKQVDWALDHPRDLDALGQAARHSIPTPWNDVITDVLDRYEAIISTRRTRTPRG